MAKNLKLNIKNAQIAEAVNLSNLKNKIAKKKEEASSKEESKPSDKKDAKKEEAKAPIKEDAPRIKARTKSAFAEASSGENKPKLPIEESKSSPFLSEFSEEGGVSEKKTSEELRKEIFKEELEELKAPSVAKTPEPLPAYKEEAKEPAKLLPEEPISPSLQQPAPLPKEPEKRFLPPETKLGPTGRHINDLFRAKPPAEKPTVSSAVKGDKKPAESVEAEDKNKNKTKAKGKESAVSPPLEEDAGKKGTKGLKIKEYRDVKPSKKQETLPAFDARIRHGLRDETEEDQKWRKRRPQKHRFIQEEPIPVRPTSLKIRVPITIKDLAIEMKLKASQLISKLFLQGVIVTLNDTLEDETTIQLLGQEFGCDITIDTSQEERIRITDKSVKEEIQGADASELVIRPPVVAFMGHVDHGKTSLIDAIRKSSRAASEAGAITQHIGAFMCSTSVGAIAILDTPGHEAFSAMRARGADVTDIVVLVVAGDEGIRQQTIEAIQHAKAAKVTIVVAINKADKPNFNPENVYRQLADQDLLPESWGGQTITVNCSAATGQGVQDLLEMLALQAEILELKANSHMRARGRVLESEMHKGMGSVATVLVQNGTLRLGDAVVFDYHWGRVKTMQDEYGRQLKEAAPSTPVEITGLSGLPEAGQEFIVVKNEREAREISEARMQGFKQSNFLAKKKLTAENLFQQASDSAKKTLNIILRADVQGSVEALKAALLKIESSKVDLNIIFSSVGEVSESDAQLASASKAVIIGFHTQIESHAASLIKELGVQVRMHDIIYHAIDDVKALMTGMLDKIAQETERGKAEVRATFKSSQYGIIAGCQVIEGAIHRNNSIRITRKGKTIAKSTVSSLKRVKEDVREVQKGLECGIVLSNFQEFEEGDILEAYDITYITQEL